MVEHWCETHVPIWYDILISKKHTDKEKVETLAKLIKLVLTSPEPKRYFEDVNEESAVIQALQLAKEVYTTIRDGSADNHVQEAMEGRVKRINNFMTRTITEDEE